MPSFTFARFLVLVAAGCFLLATFGVSVPVVALVPLGLTFWAASVLVP